MSKTLEATRGKKPTLQQLAAEVDHLRERVEDLEDVRDLKEAVRRTKSFDALVGPLVVVIFDPKPDPFPGGIANSSLLSAIVPCASPNSVVSPAASCTGVSLIGIFN